MSRLRFAEDVGAATGIGDGVETEEMRKFNAKMAGTYDQRKAKGMPLHFRKTFIRKVSVEHIKKLPDKDTFVEEDFNAMMLKRINDFKNDKSSNSFMQRINQIETDYQEAMDGATRKIETAKQDTDNGGAHWEKGHFFPTGAQLINAAKAGRLAEVKRLLRSAQALNAVDANGRSALFWAVRGGQSGSNIEGELHLRTAKYVALVCVRVRLRR